MTVYKELMTVYKTQLTWSREFKPRLILEIPTRILRIIERRMQFLTGPLNTDHYVVMNASWAFIGPYVWHTTSTKVELKRES